MNAGLSEMMQRMSDAGAPFDAIMVAVRHIEALETANSERKAKDAARKRAKREEEHVSADNPRTVHGRGADNSAAPLSPDKSPPDPQKLTPNPAPTGRVIPPRAREKFPAPEGVASDQWKGFLQLRTAKRQPMTERGYSLLCGKLTGLAEHGYPPGEMIDLAIERGWTTVHEPHDDQPRQRNGYSRDTRDPTTVALELLAAKDRAGQVPQAGGADFDVGGGPGGMDQRSH